MAEHVDALFSTKSEENLIEHHVDHSNCQIIVHFVGCMLIAMVSMHQQNEQHEYHYEIYSNVNWKINKRKFSRHYRVTADE